MSSAKTDGFISFLPIWMPFSSCLIIPAKTYNTMLNKNGKSEHPCLDLDVRGKAFGFFQSIMLVVDSSSMTFITLR